ncbi:hypothetical protein H0H93_000087 [Arthromyces matolae]|nr:hypothetical protein H0H93_000087 [Arthromyces matolae]
MSTTSWNGDEFQRHNRHRAATSTGYPSHPMSLMPGQASKPTPRPNFHLVDASRRMTIADDIRNAHNIPPPIPPPPPPPPVPPYPASMGSEFQHRAPPPLPSSTPPPPRPPLPPSLTAARSFRPSISSISPPPIPPKPFSTPMPSHEDVGASDVYGTIPRSLLPGGQSSPPFEPQIEESDIAMAIAISTSVFKEEQQKLALQESAQIAKALKASLLESRPAHLSDSLIYSFVGSSSQSAQNGYNTNLHDAESSAHGTKSSPVIEPSSSVGRSTLSGTDHSIAVPESSLVIFNVQSNPTSSSSEGESSAVSPTLELDQTTHPKPSASRIKLSTHLTAPHTPNDDETLTPSPSTPTALAYLQDHDGDVTPRIETASEMQHVVGMSSRATHHVSSAGTNVNGPLQTPSTLGPGTTLAQQSMGLSPVAEPQSQSNRFEETFIDFSRGAPSPEPPQYTPPIQRSEVPVNFTPSAAASVTQHANGIASNTAGPSMSSPMTCPPSMPPSYSEAPLPVKVEDHATKHIPQQPNVLSLVETRITVQSPVDSFPFPHQSPSSPSSVQHYLKSTTSQVDLRSISPPSSQHSGTSTTTSTSSDHDVNSLDSSRPRPRVISTVNVNAFVNKELLNGVSLGYASPKISTQLVPMEEDVPSIISLPYGKARPLHLYGPSWRHLLKLMASLSGTRMEAAIDALANIKSTAKVRTVIQFVKPHQNSPGWRTVFYFTIDYPSPLSQTRHRSVNDLPYSYTLTSIPTLLRDAAETPISKIYTIPATGMVPYPTLPITFPELALYLQAALDESRRYINDSHSDFRKLAKMMTTCYPDEDVYAESSERRGLFKRVMGRSTKPTRGGNEDTYQLVTPFVPDEWG